MHTAINAKAHPLLNAGIALHSLRAASMASIKTLLALAGDADIPIHIHIGEQTGEVDDCFKSTGKRPIDCLQSSVVLDPRWQLVHATHTEPFEIELVAKTGAGLVICPTTEANLGDGLADMPRWLQAGVPLAIGSDSHVSRDWREELRWLEYGQRLALRKRNVCGNLFDAAIKGGGAAAGFKAWGLAVGARADAVVLNADSSGLADVPLNNVLDAYVFASDRSAVQSVIVAGKRIASLIV
jgi:formimidoylglutamate deiminase